jgi:hypothetical protein
MARSNGTVKENGHAVAPANGHARPNGTIETTKKTEEDIYEEENIFLFIPNIIGAHLTSSPPTRLDQTLPAA